MALSERFRGRQLFRRAIPSASISAFSAAGCSIDVVLIDTEAHKAIDVFYITANGQKLCPELQGKLTQDLLAICQA